MLAFLVIAYLTGVSAYSTGAGVCSVDATFSNIDTNSMPQTQNQNYGTYVATATDPSGTASSTYDATSRTVTVASSSTDLVCGILGYFADVANPQNKIGIWQPNSLIQVDWSACPVNDSEAFTHMFWTQSHTSISVDWSFPAPMANTNGMSANSIPLNVTYLYPGTLYWIIEEGLIFGDNPTPAQIKVGHNSTNQPALKFGNNAIQGSNTANMITIGSGLPRLSGFTAFFFVEITSPPTLAFQSYVLSGQRGIQDVNAQLYRTVSTDATNMKLTPNNNPFDGPVNMVTAFTSGAHPIGPAMLLVAFCMWVSSQLS